MKILHTVESYFPSVGGMPEVVKQLSERLVTLGHEVTVATSYNPNRHNINLNSVKIEQFHLKGNVVNGIVGGAQEISRYKEFVKKENFDVIVNFAAQQWATDLILPILKEIKAKKVFVPTGFSTLNFIEYADYFEQMKGWFKDYDMNVFLSNDYQDINFAKKANVTKITIIPNGAAKDEFFEPTSINIRKKLFIPETDFLILDVGSHTGIKGHSEAIKIFHKAKIKNSTLLILGNTYSKRGCAFACKTKSRLWKFSLQKLLNNKKLIVTDLPRAYVVSAYQQSDLFLFTSNVECSPIVLFESIASRTPFLVTDVGNSKEIIEWTKGGILLPTTKTTLAKTRPWPRKILRAMYLLIFKRKKQSSFSISIANIPESAKVLEYVYGNKEKCLELSKNGYEAWLSRFTWEDITKQYENLYKNLTQK